MNDEPYEVIEGFPGWIKVCAWCYPGEKIFEQFPDLRGKVELSHSICPRHHQQFMLGLRAPARIKKPASTH